MKTNTIARNSTTLDAIVEDMKNTQAAIGLLLNELLAKQASNEQSDSLQSVEETKQQSVVDSTEAEKNLVRKLSYSFRATLMPILGWSELLLTNKVDTATSIKALKVIKRQAELQLEILQELEANL